MLHTPTPQIPQSQQTTTTATTTTTTTSASTSTMTKRKLTKKRRRKFKLKKLNLQTRTQPRTDHPHPPLGNQLTTLLPDLVTALTTGYSFLLQNDLLLLPSQSLTLESHLSSSSKSITKLLSYLPTATATAIYPAPSTPPAHSWFSRLLSSSAYDPYWPLFFNLTKPSFNLLLQHLTPSLTSAVAPLPPNQALAATLFRLAHAAPFSAISRRFSLDIPASCRAFYSVCKAILDNLGHLFEFKSDINRIVDGFGWISLPNCCGVLGVESFALEGRKLCENGSILVQALVDSEGRFLDVSAGWPNTINPNEILHESKLFEGIELSKEYLNGPLFELSNRSSIPQYILGNSCYPLLPWLLTPYNSELLNNGDNELRLAFNLAHGRAMTLVGTTFAKLKSRWKLVAKKWKEECAEAFPFVIVACCLLHNFLIKCSEDDALLNGENVVHLNNDLDFPAYEADVDEIGKRTRDMLASHLSLILLSKSRSSEADRVSPISGTREDMTCDVVEESNS